MTSTERLQIAIEVLDKYFDKSTDLYGCAYAVRLDLQDILKEENENRSNRNQD